MGYTRYWNRTEKPINKEFVEAVQNIISECNKIGISIRGGLGEGNPIISEEIISFNGNEELGLAHETCYFDNEDVGFNFCKTARKPYDYAVKRVLEEAERLGIATNVSDDGDNEKITDKEYLGE